MIRNIYILLLLSLVIPCNEGYTEIDGYCFYEDDISVLQTFIDNSYASGVYFVKMVAGEFINTQKLMLIK